MERAAERGRHRDSVCVRLEANGGEGRAYNERAGRSTKYGETCRVNEPNRRVTERDDARGTRRHLYEAIALSVLESTVWEE